MDIDDKSEVKRRNRQLCERYPFLTCRDRITGELETDYEYTELDDMPDGWRRAFGLQLCEELRDELLREGGEDALNHYVILQIKEKYGGLRWYSFGHTKGCDDIINRYEELSRRTCIHCGRPATKLSVGWILPFCDDCAKAGYEYIPIENN